MNRILISLAFILSVNANAESVHDRIFFKAIWSGDASAANEALKNGAKMTDMEYNNFARLPAQSIRLLIKSGYDLNNQNKGCVLSYLMQTRKLDNDFSETINFVIQNGANVNCVDSRSAASYRGQMVLFAASADRDGGDIEDARYLKAYKLLLAKSNQVTEYQDTGDVVRRNRKLAIDAAISQENKNIFKLLVDAGSPLTESSMYQLDHHGSKNWWSGGMTPLEGAVRLRDIGLIKHILSKGADINHVNNGRTALDFAHSEKVDNIELFLLKNGAKYKKYSDLNN